MKNFLGIIILGLLLSGCVFYSSKPNDLIGKKILCGEWSSGDEILITKLPIFIGLKTINYLIRLWSKDIKTMAL